MADRKPHGYKHGLAEVNIGADYSDDEREFMMAVERYRTQNNRPFPTCCEILKVLKSLGYRKAAG